MIETSIRTSPLHMAQLWLDLRRLVELGRALHLPVQRTDLNYVVHCALGELFQDAAPRPFSVERNDGRKVRVLGYTPHSAEQLRTAARAGAGPMVHAACDWPRLAAKPMPARFAQGTRLRFEVRACPVVRKSSAGKYHRSGAEVDAFLSRVWEVDDPNVPVDREQVYSEWLAGHLERSGARPVLGEPQDRSTSPMISLHRFSLERVLRRSNATDRTSTVVKRPVATLRGVLEVTDGERFNDLLRRGIGRHKSFGFGMLKVRPAGR